MSDYNEPTDKILREEITKLRQRIAELEVSEANYRMAIEGHTEPIFLFLPDGTITLVNEAYCQLLQKKREELLGINVFALILPEKHCNMKEYLASLTWENPILTKEEQVIISKGNSKWLDWTTRAFFDEQRRIVSFMVTGKDITKRRELENQQITRLTKMNEQLRSEILERQRAEESRILMHQIAFLVLEGNPTQLILDFICKKLVCLYDLSVVYIGLKEEDGSICIQERAGEAAHYLDDVSIRWDNNLEGKGPAGRAIRTGKSQIMGVEDINFLPWSEWAQEAGISSAVTVPLNARGEVLGVIGLYFREEQFLYPNLFEQLDSLAGQIAVVLQASFTRQRLQQLNIAVESAANAIVLTNREGIIQWVNPAFCQISGYNQTEILGQHVSMFRSNQHQDVFYQEAWNELLSGKTWKGEAVNRRKDNSFYHAEMTITPIKDERENIISLISVIEDITFRKQAKKQMLEASLQMSKAKRLSSLAVMAAGIAHEINQPLNSIKVTADSILYWTKHGEAMEMEEILESIGDISKQAGRIASIIKNIRDSVSRKKSSKLEPCDLNQIIQEVLHLAVTYSFSYEVEIKKDLYAELPLTLGLPNGLEEVFINLLLNAVQALGTIERNQKQITITTKLENKVVVEISDNGPGIDEKIKDKIMEPFFTTKGQGENMGMGLAIVHSIVTSCGGKLSVSNNSQGGATFRLVFPLIKNKKIKPRG